MISLSRIIKSAQLTECVLDYGFTKTFDDIIVIERKEEKKKELVSETAGDDFRESSDIFEVSIRKAQEIKRQAGEEAEKICTEAEEKAEKIRTEARQEAEKICAEAQKEGYDAGFEEGYQKAYEDHMAEMDRLKEEFQTAIRTTIEDVTKEKDKILDKYMDDLKKVALTIAEKVIQTSLKSSGEIIKRMIVTAAGKLKKTQWVKIYVSQKDAGMMIQGDVGLLNELSHISGNIKIISMDHAEDGACIIELPEEIIDVSVNTQLENIKGILNNARL